MSLVRVLNWRRIVLNKIMNWLCVAVDTLNSATYWDSRFSMNWEASGGRLQTALFATAFVLLDEKYEPQSILDFGCGCGDSLPVLKMKYPGAELYYYDISAVAMQTVRLHYKKIARRLELTSGKRFDLVYCSNVVEHVADFDQFCKDLVRYSSNYLIIQAPYNERHPDGAPLSSKRMIEEHVTTITEDMVNRLSDEFSWEIRYCQVPCAWDRGEQIFFIGTRKISTPG